MATTLIHRHQSDSGGTPVNAYLVEGASGVVVIDATLTVSGGRALRARVDAIGKPLLGVALTHAHPDHYGGLVEVTRGLEVPVFATRGVHEVTRRDDAVKEAILRPMFGDEWPAERAFPSEVVGDGQTVRLGDIALTVTDLGPSESPADSIWALADDPRRVFSADIAYNRKHAYLADGYVDEWLASIGRLRDELPVGTTLHPGHGEPAGLEILDWQQTYIETLVDAVKRADWDDPQRARAAVADTMRALLPTEELAFLMELSIEPLALRDRVLEPDQHLADVGAAEDAQEGGGRLIEARVDRLLGVERAVGEPAGGELRVLREQVEVREHEHAAQRELLLDRLVEVARAGDRRRRVVLADRADQGGSPAHAQRTDRGFQVLAADVVHVDVDAVGRRRGELGGDGTGAVVDGAVEAEVAHQPPVLSGPPAEPITLEAPSLRAS